MTDATHEKMDVIVIARTHCSKGVHWSGVDHVRSGAWKHFDSEGVASTAMEPFAYCPDCGKKLEVAS